jgi:hypothetical protein
MSFQASAHSIELVDGHILKAVVANREGEDCEAELDLDQFIGNEDGWFMWDGVSEFSALSAYLSQQLRVGRDN